MDSLSPSFATPQLDSEALIRLINAYRGKRVLVVGDVMLDEYLIGEVHRISPEAPVPVVDLNHRALVAGGAGNVASNVASLGGVPVLIGLTGVDESASQLKSVLASHHVGTHRLVARHDRATITKTRIVSGQQQIVRIDRDDRKAIDSQASEAVFNAFATELDDAAACVFSDYAKGLLAEPLCRRLIALAAQQGKPVVVDPKGVDFSKYISATIVTPNLREAEVACGFTIHSEADLPTLARKLQATLEGSAVLITRGGDGMTLFSPQQPPAHAAAWTHEVFDVTGAGDTVAAALTLALASGAALISAMLFANIAASVVVQKSGTATVTAEEVLEAERSQPRSLSRTYSSLPRRSPMPN